MRNFPATYDELLVSLALKGDPVAFYCLTSSHFQNLYLDMRRKGKTDPEARKRIIAGAADLFKKLLTTKPVNFEEWFQSHTSTNDKDSVENHEEFTFERDLDHDCSTAMDILCRQLQRISSRFKPRNQRISLFRGSSNPVVKNIGISLISLLVMAVLIYGVVLLSESSITFTINHKGNPASFSLPFTESKSTEVIPRPVTGTVKTIKVTDSTELKSDKMSDSIQTAPKTTVVSGPKRPRQKQSLPKIVQESTPPQVTQENPTQVSPTGTSSAVQVQNHVQSTMNQTDSAPSLQSTSQNP